MADEQQKYRAVETMNAAELNEEIAQLTQLVATLNGADNKRKRGRVNGRITNLREALGKLGGGSTAAAPAAASASTAAAPAAASNGAKDKDKSTKKQTKAERSESKDFDAASTKDKVVVGYWRIRGLAEPIRYLLEYTKTNYVNKYYDTGDAPEYNRDGWLKDKADPKMGLAFPNLPYLFDGSVRMTQSAAIMRHLGRKHGLYGDSEEERAEIDMLEGEMIDDRQSIMGISYRHNFAELLKNVTDVVLPAYLAKLEKYLGSKKFLLGSKLSYVDFMYYELLDQSNEMVPGWFKSSAKVNAYYQNIRNLPAIKAYLSSNRFFARPINNKMAMFK